MVCVCLYKMDFVITPCIDVKVIQSTERDASVGAFPVMTAVNQSDARSSIVH